MSQPPGQERAIGNQAKKLDDATTKGGTAKLKFVPTFAARKKPAEAEVKQEPASAGASSSSSSSSKPPPGRGRGRGRGRGGPGGGGDRVSNARPEDTMVASGPFAMGPALVTGRRAAPRTVFAPVASASSSMLSLSGAPPPLPFSMKKELRPKDEEEDEAEQYSDPDAGVEIVDLSDVRRMDYMAPETLRKERKTKPRVKIEDPDGKLFEAAAGPSRAAQIHDPAEFVLADLDDSDELQELIRALTGKQDDMEITSMSQEIFVFQFPQPFPTFVPTATTTTTDPMDVDAKDDAPGPSAKAPAPAIKSDKAKGKEKADAGPSRHVSFADEIKPLTADDEEGAKKQEQKVPLDGLIGQLEVYDDGSIKMRLGENILLDVNSATPASYLQHAVHLNREKKAMVVLGEVRQRFVVSPDLDGLLDELDQEDDAAAVKDTAQATDAS